MVWLYAAQWSSLHLYVLCGMLTAFFINAQKQLTVGELGPLCVDKSLKWQSSSSVYLSFTQVPMSGVTTPLTVVPLL